MSEFLLGIDLGTSGVKVGLVDTNGQVLDITTRGYETLHPHPGWCEQRPEDWWDATAGALAVALKSLPPGSHLAGVGLSGQAPGHVPVRLDGTPLGPAIIWSDSRAVEEAHEIARLFSSEEMRRFTGSGFPADPANPLSRLLWLVRHRTEWVSRDTVILQPKDYIVFRLTGNLATDHYSAFSVAHVTEHRYHPELFQRLGIPMHLLPRLVSPEATVGYVTRKVASTTGLPEGTPVSAGTIDAWCSVFGAGGLSPGVAVDIAGTSEVVALVSDRVPEDDNAGVMPLWPGLFFAGGPTQVGASALRWLWRALVVNSRDFDADFLETLAHEAEPGSDGLLFLPYLRGERAPIWDSHARGAFFYLAESHRAPHVVRAVYEGIAYSVRHVLEIASEATRQAVREVRVIGGGSRSAFWNQIKADVLGVPVVQLACVDGAVLGAAMLAACPPGRPEELSNLAQRMVRPQCTFRPNASCTANYDRLFRVYKALYPAVKHLFREL